MECGVNKAFQKELNEVQVNCRWTWFNWGERGCDFNLALVYLCNVPPCLQGSLKHIFGIIIVVCYNLRTTCVRALKFHWLGAFQQTCKAFVTTCGLALRISKSAEFFTALPSLSENRLHKTEVKGEEHKIRVSWIQEQARLWFQLSKQQELNSEVPHKKRVTLKILVWPCRKKRARSPSCYFKEICDPKAP